ncbi:hypothetical protein AJ88_20325 [Mesorhizobium amorphae CCBAU 01583]|nr:hypothetical protein AJ88_20325 [Mesorhizobium amorphae CCBAU 01583]
MSVKTNFDGYLGSLATFSPDDRTFATSQKRAVFIWNADDGTLAQEWQVGTWPYRVMFSTDGSRLLIGSWGTFSFYSFSALWDVSKGTQIAKLEGHKSDTQLDGASFSHDGRRIATVSLDGSARLWDGESGRLLDVLGQESAGLKLNDVVSDYRDQEMNSAFSRDDRFLATTSLDGTTRIWDINHASLLVSIVSQGPLIEHLEFSPVDTNILLTASHDGTARLWDVDGILTTVLPHKSPPTFAVFSPDNLHLLTGGADATVHLGISLRVVK